MDVLITKKDQSKIKMLIRTSTLVKLLILYIWKAFKNNLFTKFACVMNYTQYDLYVTFLHKINCRNIAVHKYNSKFLLKKTKNALKLFSVTQRNINKR